MMPGLKWVINLVVVVDVSNPMVVWIKLERSN
jgi:hypothetical protein